jgi:glycosyltransferase involved in cell wall biosynthesis
VLSDRNLAVSEEPQSPTLRPNKVCIVTPDFVGPVRNGGIGTHCYWLAKALASAGIESTVLFTGPYECGNQDFFRSSYLEQGIRFESVETQPASYPIHGGDHALLVSERVKDYLRDKEFDVIHFQDWLANGFLTIQAKRTGLGFESSLLTVTMHSPSSWHREGMKTWPLHPFQDAKLDFLERYCAENADTLISPSSYMFTWAASKGWKLPAERTLLRNICGVTGDKRTDAPICNPEHIVFFGRLESRKGLEVFCNAIDLVTQGAPDRSEGIRRVTFLGKGGALGNGQNSAGYTSGYCKRWKERGLEVETITNLDSGAALDYLKSSGGIAVMPSLVENYPYCVLECLLLRIPFLASNVGGIPEQVGGEVLFDPEPRKLAEALVDREWRVRTPVVRYSREEAIKAWQGFHSTQSLMGRRRPKKLVEERQPLVSVCVPHFNHGRYLIQLLSSLYDSDYGHFEVIAVDDGSTDQDSRETFERLGIKYAHLGWKLIPKSSNEGIGATRNFAAGIARGEFLIFMDADNLARPDMISTFVRGMRASGADCLTCHLCAFEGDSFPPSKDFVPAYRYMPIGPCMEVACLENVLGDANMCVRKSVFDKLGGFTVDRDTGFEDWEFLVKLCVSGYKLEVLPKDLFYYRHINSSMMRVTDNYLNRRRVLRSFAGLDEATTKRMVEAVLVPLYLRGLHSVSVPTLIELYSRITRHLNRFPTIKRLLKIVLRKLL